MTVIIPLSGKGQRFIDAGYQAIKPLIKVHGKTILSYVVDMFDKNDDFVFIINETHAQETNIKSEILNLVPGAQILTIPAHKKGPTFAVLAAAHFISDTQPCIINYCDFFMQWNYTAFKTFIANSNCDGAIPCYIGFHPHLVHSQNVYAGCVVDYDNNLIAIQEKHSYTENKFNSHHSVGTYYFKSGAMLKKYAQLQIEQDINLNGEYYCSLLYPQMITEGLKIKVFDKIAHFCQWGTPFDLKEYEYWSAIVNRVPQKKTDFDAATTLLMPMAGNGQRFVDCGYTTLKPMLPVLDKPMFLAALNDLPKAQNHIFITKETLDANIIPENSKQIIIEQTTQGQACTALLAKSYINNNKPLMISPCDNGMMYNQDQFLLLTQTADVIVFGFSQYQAVQNNPQQYGWVLKDEANKIEKISCKQAISNYPINDYAITGAFWFKRGAAFVQATEQMIAANETINNEYYIDVAINYCIANGLNVMLMPIDYYICWGTPNDYETFNYWYKFHHQKV